MRPFLRVRAEIGSHSAAGPQAGWRGASDDAYPVRYVRSEQQSQRACGPQPEGARSSACLANRNQFMIDHRLSRQNVKLFLREPLGQGESLDYVQARSEDIMECQDPV